MTRFRNSSSSGLNLRSNAMRKPCHYFYSHLSVAVISCGRIYSQEKKQFGEAEQVTVYLINRHVVKRCILPYICENKTAATTGTLVNICIKARCRLI